MLPVANADRRLTPDSARWNDWRWQMRKRIRSVAELIAACNWQKVPNGVHEAASRFPLAISPYYASLMQRLDPGDPVFAMSVPQGRELIDPPFLSDDPLEEERHTPVPGLVQRYSDRA
jgi:lysine 2,3-aminomutase